MSEQHTPGPWVTESLMGDRLHDICLGYEVPGAGNPIVLATVFFDEDNSGRIDAAQADANARLIAAAPDMLAALIVAETAMLNAYTIRVKLTGITTGALADHLKQIQAAIAKARKP